MRWNSLETDHAWDHMPLPLKAKQIVSGWLFLGPVDEAFTVFLGCTLVGFSHHPVAEASAQVKVQNWVHKPSPNSGTCSSNFRALMGFCCWFYKQEGKFKSAWIGTF